MTDDIATLTSERDALRQRVNELEQESTNDKIGVFCADLRTCGLKPPYLFESKAGDFYVTPVDAQNITVGLDDLAAILAENTHLKTQRDQLQRDCTRFEQEARDARARHRDLAHNIAPFMRWRSMGENVFELADFCRLSKHRDGPWSLTFDGEEFFGYPLFDAIELAEQKMTALNGHATSYDRTAFTALIRDEGRTDPARPTVATWRPDPVTTGGVILVRGESTVAEIAPGPTPGWYSYMSPGNGPSHAKSLFAAVEACERIAGVTCDRSAIEHLLPKEESK